MLQYDDLLNVPVQENNEALVAVQDFSPDIMCQYEKFDMEPYVDDRMLLRAGVAKLLELASQTLKQQDSTARLKLVYAYRHPVVQERYFLKRVEELGIQFPNLAKKEIKHRAHLLSASPDVAGHPTGGAVDITIMKGKQGIDMGTRIADFSDPEKIQTYYPHLTALQHTNRLWLRSIMMSQGFAPFDGEWWHFSYGDKEWAAYYSKKAAIYGPILL